MTRHTLVSEGKYQETYKDSENERKSTFMSLYQFLFIEMLYSVRDSVIFTEGFNFV